MLPLGVPIIAPNPVPAQQPPNAPPGFSLIKTVSSILAVARVALDPTPIIHTSDDIAIKQTTEKLNDDEIDKQALNDLVLYGPAEAFTKPVAEGGINLHRIMAKQFIELRDKNIDHLTGTDTQKASALMKRFNENFMYVGTDDPAILYAEFYPEIII